MKISIYFPFLYYLKLWKPYMREFDSMKMENTGQLFLQSDEKTIELGP